MGRRRGQTANTAGAEKKLRQAEYFLGHLENASREIAYNHANALRDENTEHLEFFFSACLSAARSVYYVLGKISGKEFKKVERRWRANGLKEAVERFKFNRMLRLRDDDVHFGTTGAETLPKYVEEDWRSRNRSPYHYQPQVDHVALFGPPPVVEMVNPDGTTVRAPILRGTVGLYLEEQGQRIEATTACCDFISQLRSLLGAVKASKMAP